MKAFTDTRGVRKVTNQLSTPDSVIGLPFHVLQKPDNPPPFKSGVLKQKHFKQCSPTLVFKDHYPA